MRERPSVGLSWRPVALAMAILTGVAATSAAASSRADTASPHITVIGDSVLTAVIWNAEPTRILVDGLDVDLQVEVCRRLVGVSCPFEGSTPPTLVDVGGALGQRLGRIVVVVAGYNEPEADFADAVEESLNVLRTAGVTRVLWASLSERRGDYTRMNRSLSEASRRHPELAVIDWADLSHDNDNWFQPDGIHLTYAGAIGMARLLRGSIDATIAAAPDAEAIARLPTLFTVTGARIPRGRVGSSYAAALRASGGTPPYRWSASSGPLPHGLRLLADGRIRGIPHVTTDTPVVFRVRDAVGRTETLTEPLIVRQ